ncbi:hypothetical protein FBD94_06025 [Pedobacter hiemivivus]|uniref:Uncharacterized protein n=1 Tax=Pedobacter hiemivivus TaxID=2530454 RepID=A0A4U1GLK8_9SPHI|nr:hypothetical protein [Pedobacter hiemivivus]TKC63900.1 hypothetical protein FBD94_06025 [Pedobacter hiemivivus]
MKKLLGLIAIMALGLTTTFAQTPAAVHTPTAKKVVKKEVKTVTTPVKKGVKATPAANVTTKTKVEGLKKDGTPDMRLKENKAKAVVKPTTAPTKKDGTPDMRYKANKAVKKNK